MKSAFIVFKSKCGSDELFQSCIRYCSRGFAFIVCLSFCFLACSPSEYPTAASSPDTLLPSQMMVLGSIIDADDSLPVHNGKVYVNTDPGIFSMANGDGSFSLVLDSSIFLSQQVSFLMFESPGHIRAAFPLYGYRGLRETLAITMQRTYLDTNRWPPDGIVHTMGISMYRANSLYVDSVTSTPDGRIVTHMGRPTMNPVKTATRTIYKSSSSLQVTYREFIETKPGTTRNNIFVFSPCDSMRGGSFQFQEISVQPSLVPFGISVSHMGDESGRPGPTQSIEKIEIPPGIIPGEYYLTFYVTVDGGIYGAVPCTIRVLSGE